MRGSKLCAALGLAALTGAAYAAPSQPNQRTEIFENPGCMTSNFSCTAPRQPHYLRQEEHRKGMAHVEGAARALAASFPDPAGMRVDEVTLIGFGEPATEFAFCGLVAPPREPGKPVRWRRFAVTVAEDGKLTTDVAQRFSGYVCAVGRPNFFKAEPQFERTFRAAIAPAS